MDEYKSALGNIGDYRAYTPENLGRLRQTVDEQQRRDSLPGMGFVNSANQSREDAMLASEFTPITGDLHAVNDWQNLIRASRGSYNAGNYGDSAKQFVAGLGMGAFGIAGLGATLNPIADRAIDAGRYGLKSILKKYNLMPELNLSGMSELDLINMERAAATRTPEVKSELSKIAPPFDPNAQRPILTPEQKAQNAAVMTPDEPFTPPKLMSVEERKASWAKRLEDGDTGLEGALDKDGNIEIVHRSGEKGLESINPENYTNKWASNSEKSRSLSPEFEKRSFFGLETLKDPYRVEPFLGENIYKGKVAGHRIYDVNADIEGLWRQGGTPLERERRITAAGYDGYLLNGELGNTIQMFKNTPVVNKSSLDEIKSSADLPNLREIPLDQAVVHARKEPHLIRGGKGSEGLYVGGPRTIKSYSDLVKMRENLDKQIERGLEGGDWYKRTNASIANVTGNNKEQNLWMSNQSGMFSAQASPETELNFALRDNNSAVGQGYPNKSKTGDQHRASLAAVSEKDPWKYQLGEKTGEYARRINPDQVGFEKATGVNDFRHFRNLGYKEISGEDQVQGMGKTAHNFADYETALAVDRANQKKLGGRSDWTGEEIQAAPWVVQKGDDFFERYKKRYMTNAAEELGIKYDPDISRPRTDKIIEEQGRKDAFNYANTTIGDSFDKHTAFATHEQQPYFNADHMPNFKNDAERAAFADDPRGSWAQAEGGRDLLYAGMGLEGMGVNMRVLPTTKMRGEYTPPGGVRETNKGEVGRPLVGFEYPIMEGKFKKDGSPARTTTKSMPQIEQDVMNAVERFRAMVDVQGAGAWHKNWLGGKTDDARNIFISWPTTRASTEAEVDAVKAIAKKYGYEDVVDTSKGLTIANFYAGAPKLNKKKREAFAEELSQAVDSKDIQAVNTDSGYLANEGLWEKGEGSGAVVSEWFKDYDKLPKTAQDALDRNPYLDQHILGKIERNKEFSAKHGIARKDVLSMHRILASGTGRFERLREALKKGRIVPALAAFVLYGSQGSDEEGS